MKTYTLTITEEQARTISAACDLHVIIRHRLAWDIKGNANG